MKRAHLSVCRIVIFLAAGLLAACGGGGGGGGSGSGTAPDAGAVATGTGTVGLLVTDNPVSDGTIKAVCITYERVELLGSGRFTLYQGMPRTFDLLSLRSHSRPLAFRDDVPAGVYEKIRLTLVRDGIELKLDDTDCSVPSEESAYPKLPGNDKLDLVVKGGIVVRDGSRDYFEIDLDGGKAVHVVEIAKGQCKDKGANKKSDTKDYTGNCLQFNFRPVVFVTKVERQFTGKLVRLVGTIRFLDLEDHSLLLCDALPGHDPGDDVQRCVKVRVSRDDSFFDREGKPSPLRALQRTEGQTATITGRLWAAVKPEVPRDHLPPPGQCRIWDPKLEPVQQSLPGPCEPLWEAVNEGQFLLTHDYDDEGYPLVVDALVIGLGETLLLQGTVDSAPEDIADSQDRQFGMMVERGIQPGTNPLTVLLQAGIEGGNGTRVIGESGRPLSPDSLVPPRPVRVDGVYGDEGAALLRSELVMLLDPDSPGLAGTTRLSGTIGTVAEGGTAFELILDPDDPDNAKAVPSLSPQVIQVPLETRLLLVNLGEGTSEPLERSQLQRAAGTDLTVNVYAEYADGLGEWEADTIVLFITGPGPL